LTLIWSADKGDLPRRQGISRRPPRLCASPGAWHCAHRAGRKQGTAERQDNIQLKRVLDNRWALAAILVIYIFANLPLQRRVWALVTAYRPVSNTLLLGLLVAAFGALALSTYLTPKASGKLADSLSDWLLSRHRVIWVLLIASAAIVPAIVAWGVLDRFPNSGDEYAYLFQAGQFAKGHLWAKAPLLGNTFVPLRTWIIDGKWLSQYPPGWPSVLATAIVAGIPAWLVNALLGAGGMASLVSPLWDFKDRSLLFAGAALYLLTAFYLFNAASLFPHVLSALLILLVCLTCLWYQRDRRLVAVVTCGVLLGLIGLTRYFSLVLLFPALAYWLFVENRGGRLRVIVLMILGGLPFLACLMAYQYWVTGSPLRDTYSLITTDDVYLSVKPDDVIHGLQLIPARFAELTIWASPLLLPVYLFCLWAKAKGRSIAFYDLIFPCFVLGYVFFPDLGGNRYGARYYFDAFPLMLVTIASSTPELAVFSKGLNLRALAANAVAISAAYFVIALPFAFKDYRAQVVMREEPYRLAAAHRLENAIVVIESSSSRGLEGEDLARNGPDLDGPVLYARPGTSMSDLRQMFPERSIWLYQRNGDESDHLKLAFPAASATQLR
jgi:hypothetical protein